jgi:hypothetical protein
MLLDSYPSRTIRLVAPLALAILLLAGPAMLIQQSTHAASRKPKEIVVVGSKIRTDAGHSLNVHASYQVDQSDFAFISGHASFSGPAGDVRGPIVTGTLYNPTSDPCDGLELHLQISVEQGQSPQSVLRGLVIIMSSPDDGCEVQRRAGGRQVSVRHNGVFDVVVRSDAGDDVGFAGRAHGHLDYLKMVGDPAT